MFCSSKITVLLAFGMKQFEVTGFLGGEHRKLLLQPRCDFNGRSLKLTQCWSVCLRLQFQCINSRILVESRYVIIIRISDSCVRHSYQNENHKCLFILATIVRDHPSSRSIWLKLTKMHRAHC